MRRTQRRHRLRLARRATVLQFHLLLARESTREDYPKLQFRSERVAIYLVRGVPEGVHSSTIAQQRAAIPQPRSRSRDPAERTALYRTSRAPNGSASRGSNESVAASLFRS